MNKEEKRWSKKLLLNNMKLFRALPSSLHLNGHKFYTSLLDSKSKEMVEMQWYVKFLVSFRVFFVMFSLTYFLLRLLGLCCWSYRYWRENVSSNNPSGNTAKSLYSKYLSNWKKKVKLALNVSTRRIALYQTRLGYWENGERKGSCFSPPC